MLYGGGFLVRVTLTKTNAPDGSKGDDRLSPAPDLTFSHASKQENLN